MANFLDTMIDYPNAKQYASGLFKKLQELNLLTEQQVKNYEAHVENLEKFDEYWRINQSFSGASDSQGLCKSLAQLNIRAI